MRDLFKPEIIVPLGFLILVIFAIISYITNLLVFPSFPTFALVVLGLVWFIIGSFIGQRYFIQLKKIVSHNEFKFIALFLIFILLTNYISKLSFKANFSLLALAFATGICMLSYFLPKLIFSENWKNITLGSMLIGLTFFISILVNVGQIPLFSGELHLKLATSLFRGLAYSFFVFGYIFYISRISNRTQIFSLAIVSAFVFALLGFRFEVTGILLIAAIVSWYKKIINFREIILIFLFLIGLITIVGYIVKKAMIWQIWHLNPVQLLFYRAGFTLYVLDEIIKMSWPFGLTYGAASFGTPRAGEMVSEVVFGYKMSLTSTLIGPPMLDFGIIGVIITMIYLGGLSGFGYKLLSKRNWFFMGVYASLISHLIIFIEAGPNFILWLITLLTMYLYSVGLWHVRNTY